MMRRARIGGVNTNQNERERSVAWRTFKGDDWPTLKGNWKDQCFCGSMTGKFFRHQWWCIRCGRRMNRGFPHDD